MRDHIVICGLGKLGFSILEILRNAGQEVCVVTRDARPELLRRAGRMAARVILEDGREAESLREACVETARALIIATSSDLVNLEIALDVRQMAPHVPIVLRMFDTRLTQSIRRDLGLAAVLNAAELSAPVFVAAALGAQLFRTFEIDDHTVNIVSARVGEAPMGAGMSLAEFSARFGVMPLALRRGQDEYTLAPSLDKSLTEGDEVVCSASESSLRDLPTGDESAVGLGLRADPTSRRFRPHRWVHVERSTFGHVGRVWKNAIPGLRIAFATLVCLMSAGVAVFHFAMNLSWLDALYFTITTVTTVGFGDINLLHAHPLVKLFGMTLMMSGVVLLLIIYSIITDYVIRQRVEQILGAKRTTLRDHVVVVGLGNVGYRVAERLHHLGEPVIAIERDETSEMAARLKDHIPVLFGDGGNEKLLLRAGVDRAQAVVAAADDDLANLRIAQSAEALNPQVRTVVRLFQSSLAEKLSLSVLGVDHPLNPAQAAAATFAACALTPNVIQGFTLGKRLLLLRWKPAGDLTESETTARALREQSAVLAILRRRGDSRPHELKPDDRIDPADSLVVLEEYHRTMES